MHRQADLLHVVSALGPPCGFASLLHGGKQQGDQDRDDRNDDQKLDQRKCPSATLGQSHNHFLR
jgi:hypothetical protein